jgi:hypothetical protein
MVWTKGRLLRVGAVLTLVATGLAVDAATGSAAGADVAGTAIGCPAEVGLLPNGSPTSATTGIQCAVVTSTVLSPLNPVPLPGVATMSVTSQLGAGTACNGTNALVQFSYRDALGSLSFTGGITYRVDPSGTCSTMYPGTTTRFTVAGTGFYATSPSLILCIFNLTAPSTPPTSEGVATLYFAMKRASC